MGAEGVELLRIGKVKIEKWNQYTFPIDISLKSFITLIKKVVIWGQEIIDISDVM